MPSNILLKFVVICILTTTISTQIGCSTLDFSNWEQKTRYKRNPDKLKECKDPMGLQNGALKDDQITASSYHSVTLNPHHGRLFGRTSWSALTLDTNQYLEFNFKDSRVITGISTQGRGDASQWIQTYMVAYRTKTSNWIFVSSSSGADQVFTGNKDATTVVTNNFSTPITCVKLRILPKSWYGYISLRMEIHGCFEPYKPVECDVPMGLENGDLGNDQITASTYHSVTLNPQRVRLHGSTSWSALTLDPHQYLEINFKGEHIISGVATQGRFDASQWVSSYTVLCYTKNYTWTAIADESGKPQIFNGNHDSNTVITNYFPTSVQCRKLRILPRTWVNYISMRLEILGCYQPYKWSCDEPMGLENKKLGDDQISGSSYHSSGLSVHYSRLNSGSSWSALTLDQKQYLEFYFKEERVISGISTQGRKSVSQFVQSYSIACRTNNSTWITVSDFHGQPQVFNGNYDSDTIITNYFDKKITCSRLRLIPNQWTNYISMRVEILGCFKPYVGQCDAAMGVENHKLKNDQITASTYHSVSLNPHHGRLNSDSSWSALNLDENQYLEFYFKNLRNISGISTQGRSDAAQWVTAYTVQYKKDNINWKTVKDVSGKDQVFVGNFDSNTIITNYFDEIITCSRLRIIPRRWTTYLSMRAEVLGCFEKYAGQCDAPMGVESGLLKDDQITASTYHSITLNPHNGRLNSDSSWSAVTLNANQFLEFYFKRPHIVSGISTQGRGDAAQWVTAYIVQYRTNNINWKTIKDVSGKDKVFSGNFDSNTIITNYFDELITCSRLRIIPRRWSAYLSMRAEVHGCFKTYDYKCNDPMGMASGELKDEQLSASTYHSVSLNPHNGRLKQSTSWSALTSVKGLYYEVYFKGPRIISGISTQGRGDAGQWVSSYKIAYKTNDEKTWKTVKDASGQDQVFNGNYDSETIITNYFDERIICSRLRLLPQTWVNWLSMRMEILGCVQPDGSQCEEPIGLQYNKPSTVDVTASTFHSVGLSPQHSQLNSPTSWAASDLDQSQYFEMAFRNLLHISAVSTQGRLGTSQWVTSYKISYIANETKWVFVLDESDQPKIFPGNYDSNTIITHFFDEPITTTKVRILPTFWMNWISMRVGFLGCDADQILTTPSTPTLPTTIVPVSTTTTEASTTSTTSTTSIDVESLVIVNASGCGLTTLEPERTIGMFYILAENHLCLNRKPIFDLTTCIGKCDYMCSSRILGADNCSTCAPTAAYPRSISLHCTNGKVFPFVYLQPTECSCSPCINHAVLDVRMQ